MYLVRSCLSIVFGCFYPVWAHPFNIIGISPTQFFKKTHVFGVGMDDF